MLQLSESTRRSLAGVQPIIVANRGPVAWLPDDPADPRQGRVIASEGGGLLTAMRTLALATDAWWVATASGAADHQLAVHARRGPIGPDATTRYRMAYAEPSAQAYNDFYNVISNPLLWFVQHHLWDVAQQPVIDDSTTAAWRDGYAAVNRQMADAAIATARRSTTTPLVMFQDYHFYLAPAMVRAAIPHAVIQHFVHIPWPEPGYWQILPREMRAGILTGMLGNDIVGFQTERDARNFLTCCADTLGLTVKDGGVEHGGRRTQAKAYPISVDVGAFADLAADPQTRTHATGIDTWRPEKLIVRVDRMDLSKNIVRGFIAYERMLEAHPEVAGHVQFYAFLQRTRTDVAEYREYMARIEAEVDRINGRLDLRGPNGELPIRVEVGQDIHRAVAAYTHYDVLLVNSVHDGMHLIAKEGPLCNERDGVLVLSEGVGAHEELGHLALSVNPFNVDETARAMYAGLVMPQAERHRRIEAIRDAVRGHDLGDWVEAQARDIAAVVAERGLNGRRGGPGHTL